jgi:hypothetical protein
MNQQAMPSAPSLRTSPVLGSKTSTPLTLTRTGRRFASQDVDVGLAEDHEQVALAGVLEVLGHVQVGVHARLQHRDAAELVELGGVGVVVEGAGDQHVEAGVAGFARGGHEVGRETVPNSGPMKMPARFSAVTFAVAAFGADVGRPATASSDVK